MKQKVKILLSVSCIALMLVSCAKVNGSTPSTSPDPQHTASSGVSLTPCAAPSVTPTPKPYCSASDIALQPPRYVPINEVGKYNTAVITDELLNKPSKLPEAGKHQVPYWTGFVLEAKGSVNLRNDSYKEDTSGSEYFYEPQIQFLSENGFNCARTVYSLSWMSNPEDPWEINVSQLEQLDELISWGLKYDVHIMISIIGLPDRWNKEKLTAYPDAVADEIVNHTTALFTGGEMQKLYQAYMTLLAARYADIPTKQLSFELLAEAHVPDGDLELYASVLEPVAKAMWASNPERLLIVNDVWKKIPEQLAAIGCSISLHTHIYSVNGSQLSETFGLDYTGRWPMEYLPNAINQTSGSIVLRSESGFNGGTVTVYADYYNNPVRIEADGVVIYNSKRGDPVYTPSSFQAEIPPQTKEIKITPTDEMGLQAVELKQEGRPTLTLASHNLDWPFSNPLPTILVHDDGTTENIDEPPHILDAQYVTEQYLQPWIDTAKKYNVGFLMTETCTDTEDLPLDSYLAYQSIWLEALHASQVPWMWNCMENVFAPLYRLWPRTIITENPIRYKDTVFYELRPVIDRMMDYQ